MVPFSNHPVSLLYNSTPHALFSGLCTFPNTYAMRLPSPSAFSASGMTSLRTIASAPPGASAWYASGIVSGSEIASYTNSSGFPPVSSGSFARIASTGSERSTTWVAPSEVRSSVLWGEAVAMIGLKPASFATWMAMYE